MVSKEINRRIDTLDYLRGFALLGIILINVVFLLDSPMPTIHSIDVTYQKFLYFFIEGRFYTIFSFLFGVGFYIFISRANSKGKNGIVLFLRRIGAMFVFGVVHSFFHPGEALTVYAIAGLMVLPFYKIKKEVNLVVGLMLLIIFALMATKILLPIPLILLGLTAGQYKVFEHISLKINKIFIITLIMFVLSVLGLYYQYLHLPFGDKQINGSHSFIASGIMIGPIISAFYVCLLILLLRFRFFKKLFFPLKSYGRMSLTNYIMQTVLILVSGHLFHLIGEITYFETLFLCLSIYLVQMIFSMVWLHYFFMGPLEWIWRWITYLEAPKLKKECLDNGFM